MSIPNFISLARLIAVPIIVYLILQASYGFFSLDETNNTNSVDRQHN